MPTYKQYTITSTGIFLLSATIAITLYMDEFKGKYILYITIVLFTIAIMLIKLNNSTEVFPIEHFSDMPNPGIKDIDNTFNDDFIKYRFKTAHNPLVQSTSKLTYLLTAGNSKWEQNINTLDYVLSRGVRALCFDVIYMNNTPYIVSGKYNEENKFSTNSSNYYDFYDVMYHLNEHATQKSLRITVPNYNDPLIIILKLHSPHAENNNNLVGSILKQVFDNKIPKNGDDYRTLNDNPTPKLNELKNKVVIIVHSEGSIGLNDSTTLFKMKFSDINIYNKQSIQNTLMQQTSSNIPRLVIPSYDNVQNFNDCTITLENYKQYDIQFVAINYKLEDDATTTCAYQYDDEFKSHGYAFKLLAP
tara:strand:+ start:581 stop:1660 length:1080 start_codon:yes stop_codon:yes gene_type:complete